MEFLKVLNLGWVGSLIGLVGLIGLVITFFLYRASRVGPRPAYQYQALRLIGREEQTLPEEVTIHFRDKKVQRLTKTRIILWNSGRATLNGKNIVADDPLRLEFSEDSEVLSAQVLNFTRQANKFTVNIHPHCPNQVMCSFDYLNVGDGAAIELLHTDEKRYPKVQGSIRGVPKGVLNWGRILPSGKPKDFPLPLNISIRTMLIIGLSLGILCATYGFLRPIMPEFLTSEIVSRRWLFIVFGLILIAQYSFLLWIIRRRFPKSLSIEDTE